MGTQWIITAEHIYAYLCIGTGNIEDANYKDLNGRHHNGCDQLNLVRLLLKPLGFFLRYELLLPPEFYVVLIHEKMGNTSSCLI